MLFDLLDNDFDSIPSSPKPQRTETVQPVAVQESHIDLLEDDDFADLIESIPPVTLQIQPTKASMDEHAIDYDAEEYERQYEDNLRMEQQPTPSPPKSTAKSIFDADYLYKIRGCNLVTIAQLKTAQPPNSKLDRTFMIKGDLQNVFDRLQVKRTSWTIGVEVTDSSGETLQLRFDNNVLNKLTDSSAAEVNEMRKRAKSMPQLTENITQVGYIYYICKLLYYSL